MANSGSRDYGGYRDRDHHYDRDANAEGGRALSGSDRRDRHDDIRHDRGFPSREQPRHFIPVCDECGEPGHYKNQYPRLVGESTFRNVPQRGQSTSPARYARRDEQRSTSEDPTLRQQLEQLTSSLANVKSYIDLEQSCKAGKEQQKLEKEKRKQAEKERQRREEEERQAKEQRTKKKEERKRKKLEALEALRKDMRMEVRVAQTEGLAISEKRKRSAERTIGNSPPMVTPAKRPTKRGELNPKRLQLSCRRKPLKRSPADKKTPLRSILKKKIPAAPGEMGKLRYVTDNLRELGNLNVEELKLICRTEDVPFEGMKKMDTILAITEKRTHVAYGSQPEAEHAEGDNVDEHVEESRTEDVHQEYDDDIEEDN
ncbi:hypothetical protein CBR_g5675 [Chara braunii]|uniref:CCHC-type domain-containing protein n=1 Tax=Chara braunii TaxID=69332 RepID=A0A388JRS6_CHABU|nr:hypothetical protein CBR_g5675 [Chara braunii]|eukprot:GBG60501.1 hypothetical protein CBR_g5675 [Chara braunii]